MVDITLSEDTEAVIQTVLNLREGIVMRLGIDCGKLVADVDDAAEAERIENEVLNGLLVRASTCIFNFLKQMEDDYGGGYIDMGPSKALRKMSEGDLNVLHLKTFFERHTTVVSKLVLMDASRRGKEELEKFGSICSEFSGNKGMAA